MWRYGTGLLPATAAQVAAVTIESSLTDGYLAVEAARRARRRRR